MSDDVSEKTVSERKLEKWQAIIKKQCMCFPNFSKRNILNFVYGIPTSMFFYTFLSIFVLLHTTVGLTVFLHIYSTCSTNLKFLCKILCLFLNFVSTEIFRQLYCFTFSVCVSLLCFLCMIFTIYICTRFLTISFQLIYFQYTSFILHVCTFNLHVLQL